MYKLIDHGHEIPPRASSRPTFGPWRIKALKMMESLGATLYFKERETPLRHPNDIPQVALYADKWRFLLHESPLSTFEFKDINNYKTRGNDIVNGNLTCFEGLQKFVNHYSNKYQFIIVDHFMSDYVDAIPDSGKFWLHISSGTEKDKIKKMQMFAEECIGRGQSTFFPFVSTAKHLDNSNLYFAINKEVVPWDCLEITVRRIYSDFLEDGNNFPRPETNRWISHVREWLNDHRYRLGPTNKSMAKFFEYCGCTLTIVNDKGQTIHNLGRALTEKEEPLLRGVNDGNRNPLAFRYGVGSRVR